jgi:hypothetical protein
LDEARLTATAVGADVVLVRFKLQAEKTPASGALKFFEFRCNPGVSGVGGDGVTLITWVRI